MPHKIVPSKIIYTSADGREVKLQIEHDINLEITIHIDGNGVSATTKNKVVDDEKPEFSIPEFGSDMISFGKEVK